MANDKRGSAECCYGVQAFSLLRGKLACSILRDLVVRKIVMRGNHCDVVPATVFECEINKLPARRLSGLGLIEQFQDQIVRHHFGETIRTQQ